jgi:hypothetical protein
MSFFRTASLRSTLVAFFLVSGPALAQADNSFRLGSADNIRVRGGGELNPLLDTVLQLSQPGGLLVGAAVGIALLRLVLDQVGAGPGSRTPPMGSSKRPG